MSTDLTGLVTQLEHIESSEELGDWKKHHAVSKELIQSLWDRQQKLLTTDPKAALRLSEWMISIAADLDVPFLQAMTLRARGSALVSVDDYSQAIDYFETALQIFNKIGDELEIARTMMNRMVAYLRVSRFDE